MAKRISTSTIGVHYTDEQGIESVRVFTGKRYLHVFDCVDGSVSVKVDGKYIKYPRRMNPSIVSSL